MSDDHDDEDIADEDIDDDESVDADEPHGTRDGGRYGDTRSVVRSMVGAACIFLAALGALTFALAIPLVFDPDEQRCSYARNVIADANEDDEDFNDVDLEGADPGDLACEEAVSIAGEVPTEEEGDDTVSVADASAYRTQGLVLAGIGLGQALLGAETLRSRNRRVRNAAALFAVAGILFPVLGILSIAGVAFVVYALVFSGAAKDIWGPFTLAGAQRRRPRE